MFFLQGENVLSALPSLFIGANLMNSVCSIHLYNVVILK